MNEKQREISARHAERALYHTLKDEGLLPPTSDADIAALEEELGTFPQSTSNIAEVFRLIEEGIPDPAAKEGAVKKHIDHSLAQAARKGKKIPPEIVERMEKDREHAERECEQDRP